MLESMVTTVDNPYSPFDEFDAWHAFDEAAGYYTTSFLARVVIDSHELSDYDRHQAIEQAVDEIIKENVSGMYRRVTRTVPDFTESE